MLEKIIIGFFILCGLIVGGVLLLCIAQAYHEGVGFGIFMTILLGLCCLPFAGAIHD